MNKKIKSIIEILIIIALFVFFSYIVQKNLGFFEGFIGNNTHGVIVYVIIEITSIVVAPITTLPIIALASNLWGWFFAGVISLFAWSVGSLIAFFIGRKYGADLVKKFIPIEKIHEIENRIPKDHFFWSVVFLRIVIPVDVLSYALGIFSNIKTRTYLLATILGITPVVFLLAYLGTVPFEYQLIALLIAMIIITTGFIVREKRRKKLNK